MKDRQQWKATLGAAPEPEGVRFEVWAPEARSLEVVLEGNEKSYHPLERMADGRWQGPVAGIGSGALYRFRIDGDHSFPDPASRYQPQGVHGPSQVVNPREFRWSDQEWTGIPAKDLIFYEVHVGTFTPEGTFHAAGQRLSYLANLGITAVELMPVADFPGDRNWGYDGVDLFAPARCYGTPDDLRRFVDSAHRLGLAVFLDVVYNHFGPDGAYAPSFSRSYFTDRHKTPWGDAINLDGPQSSFVRNYFIENALCWIHEFHMDGLRLDATHAMVDSGSRHFLAEFSERVRNSSGGPTPILIAEDHRNLAHMVKPEGQSGWGMDGVWSDDFHHEMRVMLSGEREGYYCDFQGTTSDLATILNQGWLFCGQHSAYSGKPRGSDPAGLRPDQFVIFLQNHDQVGNRAMGERLHHQIEAAAYRAATTLLLCAPQTPLLFMGQEWAAASPFCYFTNHNDELGPLVTEGRRKEFARFSAFSDPGAREKIPDPQRRSTFDQSRLIWTELDREPHASVRRLYGKLISLRKTFDALKDEAAALGEGALLQKRSTHDSTVFVIVQLRGAGTVEVAAPGKSEILLTTEDAPFVPDPAPVGIERNPGRLVLHFSRPGAVILSDSQI